MVNLDELIWHNMIDDYLETGDSKFLENKIRNNGVPKSVSWRIADILSGKVKPLSEQKRLNQELKWKAKSLNLNLIMQKNFYH